MAKYVDILFRHRIRFLLLFIALPLELATACIFLFPHESALMTLWVDTPAYYSISPAATGWNQYLTPAQNTVDAMNQLTDTATFAHTLGVDLDQMHTFQDQSERDATLGALSSDLRIAASGSHLVVLSYTCTRRAICIDVLNTTVQIYRNWQIDTTQAVAKAAHDFYESQLVQAQGELDADSQLLSDYKTNWKGSQTALLLDTKYQELDGNVSQDLATRSSLKAKINAIDIQSAAARQIEDTVLKTMDPPRVVGGRLSALPRKQMIIAGGFGLAVALTVLVVMAWLDRTVREASELERRLKLPVVSTIADLAAGSENVA